MIIRDLIATHISVPFVEPYHLAKRYGVQTHADAIIIQVLTDEGLVGLGEGDPLLPFSSETIESVLETLIDHIAPVIVGHDPRQIGLINSLVSDTVDGSLMAKGAIDMALHDIAGKSINAPTHTLLGTVRRRSIPLLFGLGSGTAAEAIGIIEREIALGHRCFMLKMGAGDVGADIERMNAVRAHFGSSITLIADANQGWSPDEAEAFFEGTSKSAPDLVEQPLARDMVAEIAALRERHVAPISADEGVTTVTDAANLIGSGAVDVFSIKVSKHGGIANGALIARMADAFGVSCLMNSMLEFGISQAASLQLGCTLPNLAPLGHAYGSVLRLSDDVTDFADNLKDSMVTVPDRPGLGVALNQEKLSHYARTHVTAA